MQRTSKLLRVGALALVGLLSATTAFAQTTTTGAVQGVVTDEATGAPMLLVTVVAASSALQGQQSEFTDASGQYFISNLPPGTYSLLFIYGDAKVRRENIVVSIGKVIKVNAKINQLATGEVITIKERAPTIDAGSTKQGTTLEQDYLTKVPQRGRTYEAAIGSAGGSQGDLYGTSFGGSTSVENNYVVDGINTTGLLFGTVGSPLLNNFIQEIEVITGGYNAEFGRATGGVVNVVTKTGSNEFHGSLWGQFVPFEADRQVNAYSGNAIVHENNLDQEFDFGFELGGPVIKDKIWFYVGFAPQVTQRKLDRIVQTQVDRRNNLFNYDDPACPKNPDGTCDGDDNQATTSAIGCELSGPDACESDTAPDVDSNGFTRAEEIDRNRYTPTQNAYTFIGKLNFAVTPDHQGQVSLNGNYVQSDRVSTAVLGTPTSSQTDSIGLTTDLAAKWTSKFNNNKTQVDLVFGWHRNKLDIAPRFERVPGTPSLVTADTPATEVQENQRTPTLGQVGRNPDTFESDEVLQFCTDGSPDDQFPSIENCPVTSYRWNSTGRVTDQLDQRYSARGTITQRVKLAGHHQFKLGGDFESNVLDTTQGYTGGQFNTGQARNATAGLAAGRWRIFRYILPGSGPDNCPGLTEDATSACTLLDQLPIHGVTQNWSAFGQDSWSILPNLTVNVGLRYEEQKLRWAEVVQNTLDPITGDSVGKNALALSGLFAPRLGVIYDWTKEGRSKVYANWGRFYESIPMDINLRSFGGEVQYRAQYAGASCGTRPMGDNAPDIFSLPENCPNPNVRAPDAVAILGSSADDTLGIPAGLTLVMPGTKAQYMDEIAAGVEYEVLEDLRVGLSYQNRRIGRVIEDMSTDGARSYFLGNPGQFDEGEEDKLVDQINSMPEDSDTRAQLEKRLSLFRAVRNFDKPTRDYHAVQLTAVKRFSRNFMMQASYTFSRIRGNYPGLFSPDSGQLDPNITSQYDLQELLGNRFGNLPADRPHNFKVDGYYTFDFGTAGRLTTGLRIRGLSGTPKNTLGAHVLYGDRESSILPRGSAGRTPFTFGSDLQLSYARKVGKMDLEVYVQLLDILNLQQATAVDDEYTVNNVSPVVGGTTEDLPYVKDVIEGTNAQRKLNYGNTSARQSPLFTRVGATLSF